MKEVSEKNIIEFHKDMDSLGIMRPDSMPRATNHICNICSFITILEDKGYAYSRMETFIILFSKIKIMES